MAREVTCTKQVPGYLTSPPHTLLWQEGCECADFHMDRRGLGQLGQSRAVGGGCGSLSTGVQTCRGLSTGSLV